MANSDVRQWINAVASQRVHGTTREKVEDWFNREKLSLGGLPGHPFDISDKVYRKVYKDCQIAFDGNRYVVPHEYVGKKVLLKIRDGILRVFDDDWMLTVYRIPEGKGQTLAHPQFYFGSLYPALLAQGYLIGESKGAEPCGRSQGQCPAMRNSLYQRLRADQEQLRRKYRKPFGEAKAIRGLLKHGLQVEVMARPLADYDQEVA
jgi:hypothetical protein